MIATIKHYAMNDEETNRYTINAIIDERAARMSDLLAFNLLSRILNPARSCAHITA